MDHQVEQLLQYIDIDRLPSLSDVLLQLLDACHSETLIYANLLQIIRRDPVLYIRIFSACNQHTGNTSPPLSAEQKLQQLGINTIKSIAVTATVQQFFSRTSQARTRFIKQNWHHAVFCATIARLLAQQSHYRDIEEAYSAGLLHDIGRLVLEVGYPEQYLTLFPQQMNEEELIQLEQEEFCCRHTDISATLLSKHTMGSFTCDAALYHHEPLQSLLDAHPLVKITYLASQFSQPAFSPDDDTLFETANTLLELDKEQILSVLDKANEHITTIMQDMDIQLIDDKSDAKTHKQILSNDEGKQIQLAEQVRNIALLDGIHQHLSQTDGNDALFITITRHCRILFGVSQSILFLYNESTNRLHAFAGDNQPSQLNQISIPLHPGRSLVADALLNQSVTHTFDSESDTRQLAVIDRQILHLGNQNGFICLPMTMNSTTIGVLVLAVNAAQYSSLWKQKTLLMRFVNEISHIISASHHHTNNRVEAPPSQLDAITSRIHEVIHEVRNPLSIMNNYLGILSYKLEDNKPAQDDIETIKAEIEHIGNIINRLSADPSGSEETVSVDINAMITNLTHIFQSSLLAESETSISLNLDKDIPVLQSNTNALKQIYTNLIKNAAEALPTKGQIMVYTQNNVNVNGKEHIELSVSDDGPGIAPNILPKLFSPMETTKGSDHAGLGLTIVKNLVSELNGSISCRSSEKGTSFHILLPK